VVVELLLTKGVNLDSKDIYSRILLLFAAENRYEIVVKLLLLKDGVN
jgi:ankyrin repeat protein